MSRRFDDLFEAQIHRLRSHRLIQLAQQGELPADALARYLGSVLHLLRQTERQMMRGKELAQALGFADLAAYFSRKHGEEKGHDTWATADLRALSKHLDTEVDSEPLPASHLLVEFIDRLVEEDPFQYVIYAVTNEYLMASIGPAWLSALTQGSGAPLSALTVLSRHIAADQVHAESGLDDAEALLPEYFSRFRVEQVTARAVELLDGLFMQVADQAELGPYSARRVNEASLRFVDA
jgi:hypothetical protein